MKFTKLKESYRPPLYHSTTVKNALSIMKDDCIGNKCGAGGLSHMSNEDVSEQQDLQYVCFSRVESIHEDDFSITFKIDAEKLSQNYRIIPVVWEKYIPGSDEQISNKFTGEPSERGNGTTEAEERVYRKITNFGKYVTRIDINYNGIQFVRYEECIPKLKDIEEQIKIFHRKYPNIYIHFNTEAQTIRNNVKEFDNLPDLIKNELGYSGLEIYISNADYINSIIKNPKSLTELYDISDSGIISIYSILQKRDSFENAKNLQEIIDKSGFDKKLFNVYADTNLQIVKDYIRNVKENKIYKEIPFQIFENFEVNDKLNYLYKISSLIKNGTFDVSELDYFNWAVSNTCSTHEDYQKYIDSKLKEASTNEYTVKKIIINFIKKHKIKNNKYSVEETIQDVANHVLKDNKLYKLNKISNQDVDWLKEDLSSLETNYPSEISYMSLRTIIGNIGYPPFFKE